MTPFVLQFPAQVPLLFIESEIESLFHGQSGCYGIQSPIGSMIYVGQAEDLRRRILQQYNGDNPKLRLFYEPTTVVTMLVPEWRLDEVERALITYYQPPLNVLLKL